MAQKRICECCGVEYYPTHSQQKYCTKCRLVDFHLSVNSRNSKKNKRPILTPTAKKNEK